MYWEIAQSYPPPHTDPGMVPLKLHTATHMSKRNDGSIDIIMVLLLLGACQGWNGLHMSENYQLRYNTQ